MFFKIVRRLSESRGEIRQFSNKYFLFTKLTGVSGCEHFKKVLEYVNRDLEETNMFSH